MGGKRDSDDGVRAKNSFTFKISTERIGTEEKGKGTGLFGVGNI